MNSLSAVLASKKEGVGGSVASTGGGISEDGTFSFGFSQLRGKRMSMEDFHDAKVERVGNQIVGLFGVFDGHGGSRAAEYVKAHLFQNLVSHPQFGTDMKAAISETFRKTDSDFLQTDNGQNRDAGSTASTAVIVGRHLLVANVGDSRAVICRGGQASALSKDHKPNRSDERERIEQAGGSVMWAGTWRVGGVLAVSRAFGDKLLKRFVVAEPEIQEVTISPEDEFLVLASDGLWDVVKDQDAVAMIRGLEDAEAAAKSLSEEAYKRGSADNITCVVIRFHHHSRITSAATAAAAALTSATLAAAVAANPSKS
eukprot:TRINITY_DN16272_c0_g1_i1.p1 TRINITY_DN16272_c0_g1~~TRINITY_DN16272_c0_g1_i1.p1  ORF type:complete len:313 (-),score=67.14 TRINITY_DN16272_c0_g1_i1:357-1295(-)